MLKRAKKKHVIGNRLSFLLKAFFTPSPTKSVNENHQLVRRAESKPIEPRTSSSAHGNSEFICFYLQSILKKTTNKQTKQRLNELVSEIKTAVVHRAMI